MCYSFVVMKKLSIPLFAMALGVCWASASLAAQASPATVTKNESLAAAYLESIRDYPAALTAFFQAMPKGGDLHHHFSGSIYTESLVDEAFRQNLYINPQTLVLRTQRPDGPDAGWLTLHEWSRQIGRYEVERRLLRHWSALDFDDSQGASYDDFFDTFGRFDLAADELFRAGLLEIKARAMADNISYIETMLQRSSFRYLPAQQAESWTLDLLRIQERQDTSRLFALLREIQAAIGDQSAQQALGYQQDLENMHRSLALDEPAFTIRYQDYVLRILPPAKVFADMLTAFQVSQRSPLVAGVNIVAPEHDPVALRDYWLHMHFYQFLSRQFPQVRYAMHAGELCLGLTRPEHLRWHIRSAIEVAGASRIGHGVGIPYEANAFELLELMRRKDIAVEINLTSNEFILGVAGKDHPVQLYWQKGVPLVLSSDDEGVLRTNLTQQYVLLAHRYPDFSYRDIKKLVYNSIQYSFIKDSALKKTLIEDINRRFIEFEQIFAQ